MKIELSSPAATVAAGLNQIAPVKAREAGGSETLPSFIYKRSLLKQAIKFLKHCDAYVMRRSIVVAAIVGPTRLLINQGIEFFSYESFHTSKFLLTLFVLFLASTLSSTLAKIDGAQVKHKD